MAKYVVFRTDGKPIPEDEPCFVIRGQDVFAKRAVQAYIDITSEIVSFEMTTELVKHLDRIGHWQLDHQPKLPD